MLRFLIIFTLITLSLFAKDKKNILVVQTYDSSMPWSQHINEGLELANKKYNYNINYYVINLDFLRIKETISSKKWQEHINNKYKNIKFDGVFSDAQYAASLVHNIKNEILNNIPKVYNEAKDFKTAQNELNQTFNRKEIVEKTIDLALKFHSKIKKVYLIEGSLQDSVQLKKILPKKLEKYPNIKLEVLNNFTIEELKKKVKNIKKDSLVFYGIVTQDKNKKQIISKHLIQDLTKINANIPFYSYLSTFIGTGIVGGHVLDGKLSAYNAIDEIMYYIENKRFKQNPNSSLKTILDYSSLEKFSINENLIDKNTIIINKPKTILESFFYEVIFASILILCLTIFSIICIYLLLKIKEANKKLELETKEKIEKEKIINQQSKSVLVGEMINNITHQWKQPLNKINSSIANISAQNNLLNEDPLIESKLDEIETQTLYMSHTIEDFSSFLSSEKKKKTFSLEKLIKKSVLIANPRLSNIEVSYHIEKDLEFLGYENELAQVLLTIINNSIDNFESFESIDASINIECKKKDETFFIKICDNGEGIKEEIIHKIFDAYFTTKVSKNPRGLGLYIAKNILNNMNGKIEAFNNSYGACFLISLK